MYCDMRFSVAKINALSCILNGVGIAVSLLSYSVIACVILAYKMVKTY